MLLAQEKKCLFFPVAAIDARAACLLVVSEASSSFYYFSAIGRLNTLVVQSVHLAMQTSSRGWFMYILGWQRCPFWRILQRETTFSSYLRRQRFDGFPTPLRCPLSLLLLRHTRCNGTILYDVTPMCMYPFL
ncbi:unnamed protein product, partial [Ectocarpus sp. 13 AM-2016]